MKTIIVIATLCLAGCATKLQITYNSDPPGATLYQGGQPFGLTPHTLVYEPDQTFRNGGCMMLQGTDVRWASGATASVSSLNACANIGYQQVYTFMRPDVAGRDVDMNFALQRQRNAIMLLQSMPPPVTFQPYQLPPPPGTGPQTNCTSRWIGGALRTTCN